MCEDGLKISEIFVVITVEWKIVSISLHIWFMLAVGVDSNPHWGYVDNEPYHQNKRPVPTLLIS